MPSRDSARSRWHLWPRLRLDIRLADLVFALGACLRPAPATEARVLEAWGGGDECMACLSVRSAFDLVLQALPAAEGDEVVFSALTHPDMVRIAEAHRLKPVPLESTSRRWRRRLSSSSRSFRLARGSSLSHTCSERGSISVRSPRWPGETGALLVEDSAQCFRGPGEAETPWRMCLSSVLAPSRPQRRSVARSSRSEILSCCSACGRSKHRGLGNRDGHTSCAYSASRDCSQSRARASIGSLIEDSHGRAVISTGWSRLLYAASGPTCCSGYASAQSPAARSRRAQAPTLRHARLAARTELAKTFSARLPPAVDLPGRRAIGECDWVFPVLVDDPVRLRTIVAAGRVRQFVGHHEHRCRSASENGLAPVTAERFLARVVFLPLYPEMPESERASLAEAAARAST